MEINFTGHNIDITDTLRSVIERKFKRILQHFGNSIVSINVILTAQKLNQSIEAILHIAGMEVNAKGISDSMYKAIDIMINKLDRQLRRHKERLNDRRKDQTSTTNEEEESY